MRTVSLVLVLGALMAANPQAARANLVCRTELADGRVLFTQPVMGQDGIFCRRHDVFDRRHDGFAERREFATPSLPQMNFTTPTAPFTTGEIGPFTTFSNSPPNGPMHHR
jgi:hypothetical protein